MPGRTNNHAAHNLPKFPVGTFGQGASIGVEMVGVGVRMITESVITDAATMISGIGEIRP